MYILNKSVLTFVPIILLSFLFGCEEKSELPQDINIVKDSGKVTSCKDGIMCREDTDCFDGKCQQGVCRCQNTFCQKDEDCGDNRCCNVLNGSCYECIKDIITETTEEDIYSDASDTGLSDQTDISDDASVLCKKNLDCPLNIPNCHPEKGICVECYENQHCKIGECNPATNVCEVADAGYDIVDIEDAPADTPSDTGADIIQDIQPDVITDPCADYICLCGSICVVEGGNPNCVAGCKKDTDCCANTVCKSGKCEKTSCSDDSDCKDGSKPHCEAISGICYECTNDLHCQSNYYCDGSHMCKYKVDECYGTCNQGTQWCNPVKKQCEDIPSNWCAACSQVLDPVCVLSSLTCGLTTKKCTKQCNDDSECFGYTCNMFGWCSCP